ncbi:hypothetical protein BDZ89DRAFT_1130239 [Hymenopellis radicata]|nr:hypothetical protein BDZ89DRAFT_1130239 [Hymenopellis radicata]
MERDETVTLSLKSLQDKIGTLYRYAEEQKNRENRIYAFWEAIIVLITRLFEQVNQNGTLFSYPQPLLGAKKDFYGVMPDSGLYFTSIEGDSDSLRVSPILFCEIKCLDLPGDWHSLDAELQAQNLVHEHLGQISLQAFCGFREFPKAETIRIILLIGIYFTVLEFQRPSKETMSQKVPKPSKVIVKASMFGHPSLRLRQATGQKTIVELMPKQPECLVFSECIFANPNKEGAGLKFSDAFNFIVRSCLGDVDNAGNSAQAAHGLGLGSCDLMNFVDAENYKMPPDSYKTFQEIVTEWRNDFEIADKETPKTPKRGPLGSLMETPTSTGKDYQITSDHSYNSPTPPPRKTQQRHKRPRKDKSEEAA